MKRISTVLFLLLSTISLSQEFVSELKMNLRKNRTVFQVVDEKNKQVVFFVGDDSQTTAVRFDNNFSVIDSINSPRPDKKYLSIIGSASKDNFHRIFWASTNNKEINSQTFNFENKQVTNEVFKLDFKKERIIQKTTINGNFYILSLVNDSNIIKFYVFDKDGKLEIKTIDASSYTLINSYGEVSSLYACFEESFYPFEQSFSLQNIEDGTPASLTFAANKRKIYNTSNEIVLSFDNNVKYTQLFKINLTDFSISRKSILQPTEGFPVEKEVYDSQNYDPRPNINSNSFIVKDKIFQIRLCPDLVQISIKDFDGNEIKSYKAIQNQPLDFKNSEIIQENGSVNKKRILDSSNQFIRKLYNSNPGITCFLKDGNYYTTIGSVSEAQQEMSGAMMAGAMFGIAGVLIAAALTSNSNVANYDSYRNRKIVYINSLFDNNFNHVNGDLKPLAFDRLREFASENKKESDLTIFKFNSYLYLGAYNNKNKTYSFNRFIE